MDKVYKNQLDFYLSKVKIVDNLSVSLNSLLRCIKDFKDHKGMPVFTNNEVDFSGPPIIEDINDAVVRFRNDTKTIEVLNSEIDIVTLHNFHVSSFNIIEAKLDELKVKLLTNDNQGDRSRYFIAADSFDNLNNTAQDYGKDVNTAFVNTNNGVLTIEKIASTNLQDKVVNIEVPIPAGLKRRNADIDNIGLHDVGQGIFYEGRFYDKFGKAKPEAGIWRFVTKVTDSATVEEEETRISFEGSTTYLTRIPEYYYITASGEIAFTYTTSASDVRKTQYWVGSLSARRAAAENKLEDAIKNDTNLTTVEILEALKQGTLSGVKKLNDDFPEEEELLNKRKEMVDGDPLTYWECELVTKKVGGWETIKEDPNSGWITQEREESNVSLSVDIIITLEDVSLINWISIYPIIYEAIPEANIKEAAVSVNNIQFRKTSNEEWKTIPGFLDSTFANVLTSYANEVLDDYQQNVILAENKFQYKGKGIWSFETIEAKQIKFTLEQRHPTPVLFEYYGIQTAQQINTGRDGSFTTSTKTKIIKVPYLNSVAAYEGAQPSSLFITTPGTSISNTWGDSNSGFLGFFAGSETHSSSLSASGEYIINQWIETDNTSKMRYAIGIREIGLYSYTFKKSGSFYSKKFNVPFAIEEIELEVDDYVPTSFENSKEWVKYYVSLDEKTWIQMTPKNKPFRGAPAKLRIGLPSNSITVGSIPKNDYYNIRLRIDLSRPDDQEFNSPKVFGYKLKIYPRK